MSMVQDEWGLVCPKCESDEHIKIQAMIWVTLDAQGTNTDESANGDHEWDKASPCHCTACDHAGTVASFSDGTDARV